MLLHMALVVHLVAMKTDSSVYVMQAILATESIALAAEFAAKMRQKQILA